MSFYEPRSAATTGRPQASAYHDIREARCPTPSQITRSAWQDAARQALPEGQSGNPRGKSLPALLVAALNEKVYITIHGKQRKITRREAIVKQMVNQSASAELRATKMLIDMMKEIEQKATGTAPPEPDTGARPARQRSEARFDQKSGAARFH